MSERALSVRGLGKAYRIYHNVDPSKRMLYRDAAALLRRGLSFVRGEAEREREIFWALRDASFDVDRGEVLGVIGRNGAGKSTLLKILSRITDPTEGEAHIYGRVGSLLEVGTGFNPELTGRENIYLNGTILGMRRREIDRSFDEIVAFAEVEQFIDTPVKRYSSGMHVRLGFAVAAHLEPEVLFIDEVLAVGDMNFQRKCLGKMKEVAGQGRTVLFVSHNLASVQSLCSRAILLEGGRITAEGDTNAVIQRYLQSGGGRQAARVDLTDWPTRVGGGDLGRFTSVALYDINGRPVDSLPFGEGCIVRLGVRFHQSARAPEIGFAISNNIGQRVAHIVSSWEGVDLDMEPGDYEFEISIPQMAFVPGLYNLTLWLRHEVAGKSEDNIEAPLHFEIIPRPVKGRAIRFQRYCQPGEVYLPSGWTVREAAAENLPEGLA